QYHLFTWEFSLNLSFAAIFFGIKQDILLCWRFVTEYFSLRWSNRDSLFQEISNVCAKLQNVFVCPRFHLFQFGKARLDPREDSLRWPDCFRIRLVPIIFFRG